MSTFSYDGSRKEQQQRITRVLLIEALKRCGSEKSMKEREKKPGGKTLAYSVPTNLSNKCDVTYPKQMLVALQKTLTP